MYDWACGNIGIRWLDSIEQDAQSLGWRILVLERNQWLIIVEGVKTWTRLYCTWR